MKKWIVTVGILTLLLPAVMRADGPSSQTCREEAEWQLGKEHRLYRSVLVGQSRAEDARIMEQRYASDGSFWYKSADNQWRSKSEGYEGTTWSDLLMNQMMDPPPRKGIFETRGVLTSELVPHIGKSIRALDCRIRMIPDWVRLSAGVKQGKEITIRTPGCIEQKRPALDGCRIASVPNDRTQQSDTLTYSQEIGKDLYEQEMAMTLMAVHYDAAYRSLLQFAGNLDHSLGDLRWPLLTTLRRTVGLMSNFSRIPCFLSSCDASPPPEPGA